MTNYVCTYVCNRASAVDYGKGNNGILLPWKQGIIYNDLIKLRKNVYNK